MHCYTAAVVLLIERWYVGTGKPGSIQADDSQERKRKITTAADLLRSACVLNPNLKSVANPYSRRLGDTVDIFTQAAQVVEALLDRTDNRRPRSRRNLRRGLDLDDVVHASNTIPGQPAPNLPGFVKDWIEKRSHSDEVPSPPPFTWSSLSINTPSVFSGYPVNPMLMDTTPDSLFWARIFDMDFFELEDPFAIWFSSAGVEGTGESDGGFGDTGMEGNGPVLGGTWGSNAEGGEAVAETGGRTVLPGSSIWESVSGPIGSFDGGGEWARSSPLGILGSSTCAERTRRDRMDEP
jgi:hypothetical protein